MKPFLLSLLVAACASFCRAQSHQEVVAAILIGEAAGEGRDGMTAVANVINNRAIKAKTSPYFQAVKRSQFSCFNKVNSGSITEFTFIQKMKKDRNWGLAVNIVRALYDNELADNTGGATHYHATSINPPYWAAGMRVTKKIGGHVFYKKLRKKTPEFVRGSSHR